MSKKEGAVFDADGNEIQELIAAVQLPSLEPCKRSRVAPLLKTGWGTPGSNAAGSVSGSPS
jgi:hypothetical protein